MVSVLTKNGNAFIKKGKIFLLIFTYSSQLEQGAKSVKSSYKDNKSISSKVMTILII